MEFLHRLTDKEVPSQTEQPQQFLGLQQFNQNYGYLSHPPLHPPTHPPPQPPPPWRNPAPHNATHHQNQEEEPQKQATQARPMSVFQARRQNPHFRDLADQRMYRKDDEMTPQQTTSASQPCFQNTQPCYTDGNNYNHPSYTQSILPNLNQPPPNTYHHYNQPPNYQEPNHHQQTQCSNQSGLYSAPLPNTSWNQHQYNEYTSNVQNYPIASTPANIGVTLPSAPTVATNNVQSHGSCAPEVDYSCNNISLENSNSNPTKTSGLDSTEILGSCLYASQMTTDQNMNVQTNNHACYSQQNFNVPPTNASIMAPFTQQASTSYNFPDANQPSYTQPTFNSHSEINYYDGAGNVHGMYATQVRNEGDEERRKALAIIEEEQSKNFYLAQGFTKRLVINPNVNIEAQLNQEYFQQCLRGLNPDVRTMQNLYGGININSAGQTHNFSNYAMTNTSFGSPGFPTMDNAQAIQHASYMRPPPPYPVPQVNLLAIDSARNEARNAEAELTASQDRRKQAEENIFAKEVVKRKAKARCQRMSCNQREAYLRFQYEGRTTRNTQNYMNNSEECVEEYLMQMELKEAQNAEKRANEKMRAANSKLKAQLEEASRIEAAQTTHRPPAYNQNFNPVGGPMRQPANRRGRRPQGYQATCRRSYKIPDSVKIENLVPTLPAIPNTIFERCLKEMTPQINRETPRPPRMEARVHCHAPFTASASIIGTAIPSLDLAPRRGPPTRAPAPSTTHPSTGMALPSFVNLSKIRAPAPSTTHPATGTGRTRSVVGRVPPTRIRAPAPSTTNPTGTALPNLHAARVPPTRIRTPAPSSSRPSTGTALPSFYGGRVPPTRIRAPAPSTSRPSTGTAPPSFDAGGDQPRRKRTPASSTTHPYRRETRSTTSNQNPTPIKTSIEKELDRLLEEHAKNPLGHAADAEDFSSEFEKLLEAENI